VLVLEDDAFISDLVSEALHDHGFEIGFEPRMAS
jgi:hypothetical protein